MYENVQANLTALLVSGCAALAGYALYHYYVNVLHFWSKKGLAGPAPLPLVGNGLRLFLCNRMKLELDWTKCYGKTYGTFKGSNPVLVVADPEVLRQICIKDFECFQNHDRGSYLNEYQENFLFWLQDDRWRRVRALISPTFTSAKMRRMFKLLDNCANDLVEVMNEHKNSYSDSSFEIDIKKIYQSFTMDAIATCCYGLKLNRISSKADSEKVGGSRQEFIKASESAFNFGVLRIFAMLAAPNWVLKMTGFKVVPRSSYEDILAISDRVIKARRGATNKPDDYLQSLLDSRAEHELEVGDLDIFENHHAGLTNSELISDRNKMLVRAKRLMDVGGLNELELMASSLFFLTVGLETTGTLLAHCTYTLAFHQEIQERLREEIRKIAKTTNDDNETTSEFRETKHQFDYETLTSCLYLDAVISESLRILPPILHGDRICNQNCKIDKLNLTVPAGMRISPAFYSIMNDPDYWEAPEVFDPDRFLPENRAKIVPGTYCPFGLGPRHCIGMRFALTEAKLALAKMLLNYRFEPAAGTEFPPQPKFTFFLNNIRKPVVKVVPLTE